MSNVSILKKIISENTGINLDDINNDSCAKDFARWDSISHVKIIVAIEKKFKKKINTSKMSELNSVKKIDEYLLK